MTRTRSTALLISMFLLVGAVAFGQAIPPYINYQGKLTDAAGAPLTTANYTLTFNVYDAVTGGTKIWGPQVFDGTVGAGHGAQVPVVNGHFNVILGPVDTTSASILNAFSATSATRYLEVMIGAGPNPISPRQQILSAPYAVTAANLRGTTNVVPSSGNVGIGTTTPAWPLSVASNTPDDWVSVLTNSNANGYGLLVRGGDGSGTAPIFQARLASGAARLSILENGNVQIGDTGDTGYKLDVLGSVRIQGTLYWGEGLTQKVCMETNPNNWRMVMMVPQSWTQADCQAFCAGTWFTLGCMGPHGIAWGGTNSSYPGNGCGW